MVYVSQHTLVYTMTHVTIQYMLWCYIIVGRNMITMVHIYTFSKLLRL